MAIPHTIYTYPSIHFIYPRVICLLIWGIYPIYLGIQGCHHLIICCCLQELYLDCRLELFLDSCHTEQLVSSI